MVRKRQSYSRSNSGEVTKPFAWKISNYNVAPTPMSNSLLWLDQDVF